MKAGDVVEHEGRRWRVITMDPYLRTAILMDWEGAKIEVADDLGPPELTVLFNPAETWPFVTSPKRGIARVTRLLCRGRDLEPMVEWVPSDILRSGGSIFVNPALRLRTGEVLSAVYADGRLGRINVKTTFGTVQHRMARQQQQEIEPRSIYERLMGGGDNDFEDD